jgi:hypothetical protein
MGTPSADESQEERRGEAGRPDQPQPDEDRSSGSEALERDTPRERPERGTGNYVPL